MTLEILLIENDRLDQSAFIRLVEKSNLPYRYRIAETVREARTLIKSHPFDVILVDYHLSDGIGFDVLDAVPSNSAVIFVTGAGSEETAVEALRAGANDYLVKDENRAYLKLLPLTIERAVQQKRRERELVILSQAVKSSTDNIYVTDLANRITHVNHSFCQTYGYKPEEIIGRPAYTLIAWNSKPKRRVDTGEIEIFHRKRDGTQFPISMTESPVITERGILLGNVIVVRDFSERIRQQKALEESEARYRSLVTAMAEGVILQSSSGEILTCNFSAERILGRSREALTTLSQNGSIWDKVRNDGKLGGDPALTSLRTGESQHKVVLSISTPENDETWITINTEPLRRHERGEPFAVVSSFSDITPLKRAIAERDDLIEQLDDFAHTVAHDLKNPAGQIIGFAELLIRDFEDMETAELRQFLSIIANSGHSLVQIIEALLLLAGVGGMQDVPFEPVDMTGVIKIARERLHQLIIQKKAQIAVPTTFPRGVGYSPWVEEIMVNYVSNALKYGGDPPEIEIGAETIPDQMIRYWVRDNGPGLTKEDQACLFQPFTRLSSHSIDGHGLGLSVVRRIAERSGGAAGVISQPGAGSEFWFTLPAAPKNVSQKVEKEKIGALPGGL